MTQKARLVVLAGILSVPVTAQEPAPVFQTQPQKRLGLHADLLLRQEWLRDVFLGGGEFENQGRRLLQFRPRIEIGTRTLGIGVGAEFNLGSDRNTDPPEGQATLGLIRDNYDSRDARLDLAYLRLQPFKGLRLEGGRFFMPVPFSEMIWDKDLRPQGAAVTLGTDPDAEQRFSLTGLWARGSHVFDDDETDMYVASAELQVPAGRQSTFQLVGSYIEWRDVQNLEPKIRRQNTRVDGRLVNDYKVVDVVARLRTRGRFPAQLVADASWNTAVDDDQRGLWLALVLGSIRTSLMRLEYTYASVDKDATLAAYGGDDFFWVTGWSGHRLDLSTAAGPQSSLHVIGQLQRFKDSPRPEERDHWLKRLRIELRATY